MQEREVKLLVDSDVVLPPTEELLAGLGRGTVEYVDQEAVYFDTPDLRLTRAGVSLRYRSDDGWTVKLPEARTGATFVRRELQFPGDRSGDRRPRPSTWCGHGPARRPSPRSPGSAPAGTRR